MLTKSLPEIKSPYLVTASTNVTTIENMTDLLDKVGCLEEWITFF